MTTPHAAPRDGHQGAHHDGRWAPASRLGAASLTLGGVAFAGLVLLAVAFALGLDHADSYTDSGFLLV